MTRFNSFLLSPLLLCCGSALLAQTIVLETSTALDGRGATLKNQRIVIKDGKSESIGSAKIPTGAVVYDLRGLTVTPGWIARTSTSPGTSIRKGATKPEAGTARRLLRRRRCMRPATRGHTLGGFTTVQRRRLAAGQGPAGLDQSRRDRGAARPYVAAPDQ